MNLQNKETIDITPKTSIFKTFKKYTYKNDSAISEVLDNSTQSYLNHKEELSEQKNFIPSIEIIYYSIPGSEQIMICDNSFGVEDENISRIFLLQDLHKNIGGRNEFGMGLKTAGFWFGNKIEFISKQFNKDRIFRIEFDLDNLETYGDNIVIDNISDIDFKKYSLHNHGTTVIFSNLNKKMRNNSLRNLVSSLAIKFGNDIIENNFQIRVLKIDKENNLFDMNSYIETGKQIQNIKEADPITYTPQKYRVNENSGKEFSKLIDEKIIYNNNEYVVTGKIGILEKGSRSHAGLILKRRGRTIIGNENGTAYRPKNIFKTPASFEYQRLHGYLNLDNFPVNQSKSDFDWDEELQYKFDELIYNKFATDPDFIKKCRQLKFRSSEIPYRKIFNQESANSLKNNLKNGNVKFKDVTVKNINTPHENKFVVKIIPNEYGKKYTFNLFLKSDEEGQTWLKIKHNNTNEDEYDLILDKSNPFFNPFSDGPDFIINQLAMLAIYFAYSEIKHSLICNSSSEIRNEINKFLIHIKERK